tara:strand:- start:268 stop:561 length:294 start_codon:yes stop_codon:yes gene_type:complete
MEQNRDISNEEGLLTPKNMLKYLQHCSVMDARAFYWTQYDKSKDYSKGGFTELGDSGYVIYVNEDIETIAITRMKDDKSIVFFAEEIFEKESDNIYD